ncbi:MAG: hypothetical protein AB7I42_25035 [Bradyrhizobium sp.]|uniref:hypothetical protein n=1 Tax=Bradyrhizobium sp. TaxID=376 RepID=UPI003D0D785F
MSIASLVRRMAEAGAPPEAIALAVEAIEAEQAKEAARKAKRAEQKRRERDTVATVARQSRDTPPSDKEKSPTPPKEITTPHSPPKGGSYTPRDALAAILDTERAQAVVDHRQRIRKPLTAHAAKLLAGRFAKVPDPNAAADAMIANGWQGFEPEWLEDRTTPQRRATAPPKPPERTVSDVLGEMKAGTWKPPETRDERDFPAIPSFDRRN